MSPRLEAQTSLVTGSTSNIGRAIALAFAAEGSHVIVSGRSTDRGAEVVDRIRTAGGRPISSPPTWTDPRKPPKAWPPRPSTSSVAASTCW